MLQEISSLVYVLPLVMASFVGAVKVHLRFVEKKVIIEKRIRVYTTIRGG